MTLRLIPALALCAGLLVTAGEQDKKNNPGKKVKDYVCGMTLEPKDVVAKEDYKGKTYYFCSREDKAEFDKNPEKYANLEKQEKK